MMRRLWSRLINRHTDVDENGYSAQQYMDIAESAARAERGAR